MRNKKRFILLRLAVVLCLVTSNATAITQQSWVQLSSSKGELPKPVETTTSGLLVTMLVLDIDNDDLKDVVIGSYTQMYWYKQGRDGQKITFIAKPLDLNIASTQGDASSIEAGGEFYDIDGDGDLDIVQGGHRSASVWWWENPYPDYATGKNWDRYTIRTSQGQCHDQLIGDFDGNGKMDLVVWDNNSSNKIYLAEIPSNPKTEWNFSSIASFTNEGEEGLFAIDMNNDKVQDVLAGHSCIYFSGGSFKSCLIDGSYQTFSRIAGGQFITGGTPEVLIASGDRSDVINMYSIADNNLCGSWTKKTVEAETKSRHTLQVGDINKDGMDDFFSGASNGSGIAVYYSDGNGNFTKQTVHASLSVHESKIADIDNDGDIDLVCKSLGAGTSATFDIFLNSGLGTASVKNSHLNRQSALGSNSRMTVYTLQGKKVQTGHSASEVISGVTLIKTNNGIVRQIGMR